MESWVPHVVSGVAIAVLGWWVTWLQSRSGTRDAKIAELDTRLVKIETLSSGHAEDMGDMRRDMMLMREGLADVREHMIRREDLEHLKRALKG